MPKLISDRTRPVCCPFCGSESAAAGGVGRRYLVRFCRGLLRLRGGICPGPHRPQRRRRLSPGPGGGRRRRHGPGHEPVGRGGLRLRLRPELRQPPAPAWTPTPSGPCISCARGPGPKINSRAGRARRFWRPQAAVGSLPLISPKADRPEWDLDQQARKGLTGPPERNIKISELCPGASHPDSTGRLFLFWGPDAAADDRQL